MAATESPAQLADTASGLIGHPIDPQWQSAEAVTRAILDAVRRHLGMETAFIAEFVGDQRVVRYVEHGGLTPPFEPGDSDPRSATACQCVVDHRMPALVTDCRHDPVAAHLQTVRELAVRAHMSVPIQRRDGSLFGTLCCFQRGPDPTLAEADLAMLSLVADVTAKLIELDPTTTIGHEQIPNHRPTPLDPGSPSSVGQPIVDLASRAIVGFDMRSPLPMARTCPAERMAADGAGADYANTQERRCLDRAGEKLRALPNAYFVSVNVSPSMLTGLALQELLASVSADRLVIEIAEHAIVDHSEGISRELAALRAEGARLAVDAGAGYASFRQIRDLNPDLVKLDIGLTRDVDTEPRRQALAAGVTEFARASGLHCIAEGIETESELRMLQTFGQAMGQGPLFASTSVAETSFAAPAPA